MMLKLYDYHRSSASYRVRIGLNLKGVAHETIPINILPGKDEQFAPANRAKNPAARVPFIETTQGVLTQSLAVLDWLDETYPEPAFLPKDPWLRAQVRSFAYAIGCDIHPLNNSSVLQRLRLEFGASEEHISVWYAHWIQAGFHALEAQLQRSPPSVYAFGDAPTLADILLVPQVTNAHRFKVDISAFPRIIAADAAARAHPAFATAAEAGRKSA